MPRALITLTTDFGLADHFVGTMKGVILGIAPRATIVDITHEIAPFQVNEGGFAIAQAYRYFPKGTVHVVVVDPGVGTSRRAVLTEAAGQYFVAPDNGVLTMIYEAETRHKVRAITNAKLALATISRTFHGRDVFAPAAAHLVRGVPPATFGKIIHDYVRLFTLKPTRIARCVWSGTILWIDRFGNLITNLHIDDFPDVKTQSIELRVGLEKVQHFARTFSEAEPGALVAIAGSYGYIEVAANQASAARKLGCDAGSPVELEIFYD